MSNVKKYKKSKKNYRMYKKKSRYTKYFKQGVPSGIQTQRVTCVKYCEVVDLGSTAGILQRYAFRANSIFDPNFTSIGHAPMSTDQWARLYGKYLVLGSRCTVRMIPNFTNGDNVGNAFCGVHLSKLPNPAYTTGDQYVESNKGTYRVVTWNGGVMDSKQVKMISKYSPRKFFNIKDPSDNPELVGITGGLGVGSNPANEVYYVIWIDSPTVSSSFSAIVTIDYIVQYREPRDLPQS